jgi:hypothetical protein
MATRARWEERVRRWEGSGFSASEFASREGCRAKELGGRRRKLQTDEPAAVRVEPRLLSVRVEEPTTACAVSWVEIGLPGGALVRVLPGVDAVTFACVLAVAAELSAKGVTPAHPTPAAHVASRRGRR